MLIQFMIHLFLIVHLLQISLVVVTCSVSLLFTYLSFWLLVISKLYHLFTFFDLNLFSVWVIFLAAKWRVRYGSPATAFKMCTSPYVISELLLLLLLFFGAYGWRGVKEFSGFFFPSKLSLFLGSSKLPRFLVVLRSWLFQRDFSSKRVETLASFS